MPNDENSWWSRGHRREQTWCIYRSQFLECSFLLLFGGKTHCNEEILFVLVWLVQHPSLLLLWCGSSALRNFVTPRIKDSFAMRFWNTNAYNVAFVYTVLSGYRWGVLRCCCKSDSSVWSEWAKSALAIVLVETSREQLLPKSVRRMTVYRCRTFAICT